MLRAFAALDEANAADPRSLSLDGGSRPRALAQAEMATGWVLRLDPAADDAQLLAARGHHFERWRSPRSAYPAGRAGYLRWRADAARRSADGVAAVLRAQDWDEATLERVGEIIRKERLRTDPQVQTHEDALCLVFLQTQLGAVGDRLGDEATVGVLVKTLAKMSPHAVQTATTLELTDHAAALLDAARQAAGGDTSPSDRT